jgi:hypothetical protein
LKKVKQAKKLQEIKIKLGEAIIMQKKIENPITCRVCGGIVRNLTGDEQEQFNLIPAHNRGKCIKCKRSHIIHREKSGRIITATIM